MPKAPRGFKVFRPENVNAGSVCELGLREAHLSPWHSDTPMQKVLLRRGRSRTVRPRPSLGGIRTAPAALAGREAHVTSCPGPTPGPASVVTAFLALSPTPLVSSLFPRDGPIRSPPLACSQLPLALLSGDFHAEPGPLAKRTSRPCASGGFCLLLFFRASPTAADGPFEVPSGRR